jgi:hypothetical protein
MCFLSQTVWLSLSHVLLLRLRHPLSLSSVHGPPESGGLCASSFCSVFTSCPCHRHYHYLTCPNSCCLRQRHSLLVVPHHDRQRRIQMNQSDCGHLVVVVFPPPLMRLNLSYCRDLVVVSPCKHRFLSFLDALDLSLFLRMMS